MKVWYEHAGAVGKSEQPNMAFHDLVKTKMTLNGSKWLKTYENTLLVEISDGEAEAKAGSGSAGSGYF